MIASYWMSLVLMGYGFVAFCLFGFLIHAVYQWKHMSCALQEEFDV